MGPKVRVLILIGPWRGLMGDLLDAIPNTPWWNVRVVPGLRLALKESEFERM